MSRVGISSESFDLDVVAARLNKVRAKSSVVVQCHGVFDLMHPGHVSHLAEAKAQGDLLVVTVTPDRYVDKGPGRPIFDQNQRAQMLRALEVVDFVAITGSPTAVDAISILKPDVFVKGPDYVIKDNDISGNIVREEDAVKTVGGRIHFTQAPAMSSSKLINSHVPVQDLETQAWVESFRETHSEESVLNWLSLTAELKVLVIGEAIIDEYVRCEALGKSSKDPVLAFREISHERQVGGSLAIASHCGGIGAQVTALFILGSNSEDRELVLDNLSENVTPEIVVSSSHPTIIKRRYVDELTEARVFETYVMNSDDTSEQDNIAIQRALRKLLPLMDVVLVADYGHGLMSQEIIEALIDSEKFLAVNTQSNAGNRGFNTISRYAKADFVCLNGGEMALELRRRHLTLNELVPQLLERTGAQRAIVTEGARGLACSDDGRTVTHVPAFAQSIKDRVGAGDALFATTSLLTAVGAPADITGFFGNLAGAASVAELGNRTHITGTSLKRHAVALLK